MGKCFGLVRLVGDEWGWVGALFGNAHFRNETEAESRWILRNVCKMMGALEKKH